MCMTGTNATLSVEGAMYRLALVLSTVSLLLWGQTAAAQQPACTDRTDVLDHLSNKYSEAPVAMGIANNGGVIEILSSKTGNSWTIILTMPNGMTCMIAAGENWESIPRIVQVGPAA